MCYSIFTTLDPIGIPMPNFHQDFPLTFPFHQKEFMYVFHHINNIFKNYNKLSILVKISNCIKEII